MNLEDHVGDIIRKARQGAKVALETAANAAGLTPAELGGLESSGQTGKTLNWSGLTSAVGLQAGKLEALAKGWRPLPVDTSGWREIQPLATTLEGNTVNCYLVWDEVTREAALFDTGWEAAPVFAVIEKQQLQLKHLFITHTHEDHIAAMGQIRGRFPKIFLHTNAKSAPPQHRNRANDFIHLGSLRITNRDTPGHAEDGVTYIVGNFPDDAPNAAIVGDALFAGSIGGAAEAFDLARGKIREQILTLPPATLICPGHGPLTTVVEEKTNNPFF